jgi:hypothetical protein
MIDLTTNLIRRTTDGTITWGETAEENTFRAVLSTGIVRVGRHENSYGGTGEGAVPITTGLPFSLPAGFKANGDFIYSLFVLDNQSREIGRFVAANQEDADSLQRLWEVALSVVRNPEKKIDKHLEELLAKPKK